MKWIRWLVAPALAMALVPLGCGERDYGPGCKKPVPMTAPWTEMSLPVDEQETRICASSPSELKLRSYEWTSKARAQATLTAAAIRAGYGKDRCSDKACYFVDDGKRLAIQPMDFKGQKGLLSISLRLRDEIVRHDAER